MKNAKELMLEYTASSIRDPKKAAEMFVSCHFPDDNGKFRNVVPKAIEDLLKSLQAEAWKREI
jgi:hypothetical protein